MKCHECAHENTEGAWLCINCGAKLKRDDFQSEGEESTGQADDPIKFEPNISENLRRLRERASGEQPSSRTRRQSSSGVPKLEVPNLTGGSRVLGLPVSVWVLFAVIFIIALMFLSNLQ
jgi:hypothetical protein